MLTAGAIVAAFVIPLAVATFFVTRFHVLRLLPPWRPPITPTRRYGLQIEGFDFLYVLTFCLLLAIVYPVLVTSGGMLIDMAGLIETVSNQTVIDREQTRQIWGVALAAPVIGGFWLVYLKHVADRSVMPAIGLLSRDTTLGVVAWLVATPLVFAVHFATVVIAELVGSPPDEHPITKLGIGGSPSSQVFFFVVVCVFTPLAEEVLFRGFLVGWAGGRRYRPWVLMGLACGFAVLGSVSATSFNVAPVGFVAVVAAGLFILTQARRIWLRFPVRSASAIYSTAALFAAAHSAVWPTPVPLFVLGIGLGYVVARSRGVTAAVVMHGLFNAVSFVFLLRGQAG